MGQTHNLTAFCVFAGLDNLSRRVCRSVLCRRVCFPLKRPNERHKPRHRANPHAHHEPQAVPKTMLRPQKALQHVSPLPTKRRVRSDHEVQEDDRAKLWLLLTSPPLNFHYLLS